MNDTSKTCLLKSILYFAAGLCATKPEFQQLLTGLALIEVTAATNPWLKK